MEYVIRLGDHQVFLKEPHNYPLAPTQNTGFVRIERVHLEKQFLTFFQYVKVENVIRLGDHQVFLKEPHNYPLAPTQNMGFVKIEWVHLEKQFLLFFQYVRV